MAKDKNYKKLIQEVQDTGDEAARMLADLESDTESNPLNYRPDSPSKDSYLSSNKTIDQDASSGIQFVAPIAFFGLVVLFVTIGAVSESSNDSASTASSSQDASSSTRASGALTEEKNRKMDTIQKKYYRDTLSRANTSVLKKEHKDAIERLKILLQRQDYKNLNDIDRGLVNNKIIQAKKKMAFLDQPGNSKYWEGNQFGYQWFDNHKGNNFHVFFAYSKQCKNPVVTFGFKSKENGVVKARYTIRPKTNLSTLYVPMQLEGRQWITPPEVKCG